MARLPSLKLTTNMLLMAGFQTRALTTIPDTVVFKQTGIFRKTMKKNKKKQNKQTIKQKRGYFRNISPWYDEISCNQSKRKKNISKFLNHYSKKKKISRRGAHSFVCKQLNQEVELRQTFGEGLVLVDEAPGVVEVHHGKFA